MQTSADRNTAHLFPAFAAKYTAVLKDLQVYLDKHHLGMTCKMIEGYRTAEYQHWIWLGRPGDLNAGVGVLTHADGYRALSNHQSACAADVGFFLKGGSVYVDEPPSDASDYYGHLLRAAGLEWGGNWVTIKDDPHGQIPATDHASYGAARTWLSQQPWH